MAVTLNGRTAHIKRIDGGGDHMGKTPMCRVKARQMRVGFHRAQIVDGDHLDIGAPRLQDGAQHIAPETVDGDFDSHDEPLSEG